MARAGMAVGLLGGSFDPPHAGHVHLTREALKRLGLDQVWWLVTPGNPLKPHGPAPLGERLARSRQLMRHPRVRITDLEHRMGTRYTADTLAALQARYPGVRFVWLMGADNLAGLHRWDDWTEIPARMPMGIIARPGNRLSAGLSPAARLFGAARVRPQAAHALARMAPPAWAFLNLPMRGESSSALRRAGAWSGT